MNKGYCSFIIILSLLCGVNVLSLRIKKPDRINSIDNHTEESSAPSLSLCKTSAAWTSVLVFYGSTPDCHLPECAGHCKSDSDCASNLSCFQPSLMGMNTVPGCETVPYDNTNYCVAKELTPSSAPSQAFEPSTLLSILPTMSSAPSRSPSTLPSVPQSSEPSMRLSIRPSSTPSRSPSTLPSVLPTISSALSSSPTREPTISPTLTMNPTRAPQCSPSWKQLGNAIDTHDNYFAMAKDRLVVAVGNDKLVNVYKFDENSVSWIQIAEPINTGMVPYDYMGFSLSMSSDGSVVAIGDRVHIVKIFAVHPEDGWTQLGQDVLGEFDGIVADRSGCSIKLSADGTTVAVGALWDFGKVRVYKYDTRAELWVQRGSDIVGEGSYDFSGSSVSISRDGTNVAIGAPKNDGNGYDSGHVRVYTYDDDTLTWIQRGGDIDGEAAGDSSGWELAISGDGSTVAIGAYANYGNGYRAGHVRIHIFDTTNNNWDQRGGDIDGVAYEYSAAVDISDDGTTIIIGGNYYQGGGRDLGRARVYQYDTTDDNWIQKGVDLIGAYYNRLGVDVFISSDGIVVGAIGYIPNLKVWKWTTCTQSPSSMPSVAPNCDDGQHALRFDITTDRFPHQTTWIVKNLEENTVLGGGPYNKMFANHSETNCLEKGCYRFTIQDSSSDGLCCNWFTGNGKYELFLDSVIIKEGGNFTSEESSIQFGIECPSSAPSISSSPSISIAPTIQNVLLCPPGTFVNSTELDLELRCQPCLPGSYQDKETRSATCIKCKEGSYQEQKGRSSCNLCQVGTYQVDEGQPTCESCPRGSFQVEVGQTECNECRAGGYCDTSLSGTCDGGFKPCRAGTYNDRKGQFNESSCLPCPAGKYGERDGLAECLSCPYRLGSISNSTLCAFCAAGFYLRDPQVKTREILKTPDDLCLNCPDNVECPENTTIKTLRISPNFWRDSLRTATVYQCKYKGVCISGNATPANNGTQSSPEPNCKDGHSGPLCEVCETGKYLKETSEECSSCPTTTRIIVTIIVMVAICIVIIMGYVATASFVKGKQFIEKVSNELSCIGLVVKLKILLSFFQVVSILDSVYGVRMDDEFKAWFDFIEYFNFQILSHLVPKQCFGSMKERLLFSSTWPFFILVISITGKIIYSACIKKIPVNKRSKEKILYQSLRIFTIVVYILLPPVSNNIFDAIKCRSFATDDSKGGESSYLLEDLSIRCELSDEKFKNLWTTFVVLFAIWPVIMPLLFATLLGYIKKPVTLDRITDLSEACRFLWCDYDKDMMAWEILDIYRRITLTGLIMFVDIHKGSERLLRLVIAIIISTVYLGVLALARPYKRDSDLYLSFISNILLIGCFSAGVIIHMCNESDAICERFIGSLTSYQASYFAFVSTLGMMVLTGLIIIVLARATVPIPKILVASTSTTPNLETSEGCHFHMFLSHVWSTGQETTHNIVRMLQLYLPGVRIWLDVDNLDNADCLEESVRDSELFALFYSKGYFKSKNCCREMSEAISQHKPIIVLYDGNNSTIETLKIEVRECFPQDEEADEILLHILKEGPILWLGCSAKPFAMESVKLVVLLLLHKIPYYRKHNAELNGGLQLGKRLDPSGFTYPEMIFYCNDNEGVRRRVVADLMEKITGEVSFLNDETRISRPVLDKQNEVLILYLNNDLFQDTHGKVSELVEKSLKGGRKTLLIWENDANKGGCDFKDHMSQTPQVLLNLNLYGEIALPLHTTSEYREVSLYLILKKLSEINSPEGGMKPSFVIRSALKRCIKKSLEFLSLLIAINK